VRTDLLYFTTTTSSSAHILAISRIHQTQTGWNGAGWRTDRLAGVPPRRAPAATKSILTPAWPGRWVSSAERRAAARNGPMCRCRLHGRCARPLPLCSTRGDRSHWLQILAARRQRRAEKNADERRRERCWRNRCRRATFGRMTSSSWLSGVPRFAGCWITELFTDDLLPWRRRVSKRRQSDADSDGCNACFASKIRWRHLSDVFCYCDPDGRRDYDVISLTSLPAGISRRPAVDSPPFAVCCSNVTRWRRLNRMLDDVIVTSQPMQVRAWTEYLPTARV